MPLSCRLSYMGLSEDITCCSSKSSNSDSHMQDDLSSQIPSDNSCMSKHLNGIAGRDAKIWSHSRVEQLRFSVFYQ